MYKFTNSNLSKLRNEMQDLLDNYGFKDVEFDVGNCRYTSNEATFKIKAKIKGTVTREETALRNQATRYGLDLNKTHNGYKLVEYHPRKHRYPFISENAEGKRRKMSPVTAQDYFGK